jgi:Tfp pilus assembly protein PilV
MKYKLHIKRFGHGLSLIEVMVAVVILLAAVIGATRYQYYTVLDAKKADLHMEATRLAVTMLEGWKGTGGEMTFDPLTNFGNGYTPDFKTNLVLEKVSDGVVPMGMDSCIGEYCITGDRATYLVTLSRIDVDMPDDLPAALNVSVKWGQHGHDNNPDKSFSLTSYESY